MPPTMQGASSSSKRAASSSNSNSNSNPIVLDSSSDDDEVERKGRPSQYTLWPYKDEALILRALAAGRRRDGRTPQLFVLYNALCHRFVRKNVTDADLSKKVSNLRTKYWEVLTFHKPLRDHRAREIQRLSAKVWGHDAGDDSEDDDFDL